MPEERIVVARDKLVLPNGRKLEIIVESVDVVEVIKNHLIGKCFSSREELRREVEKYGGVLSESYTTPALMRDFVIRRSGKKFCIVGTRDGEPPPYAEVGD